MWKETVIEVNSGYYGSMEGDPQIGVGIKERLAARIPGTHEIVCTAKAQMCFWYWCPTLLFFL